jgi:hypothetical protein
MGRAPNPIKQPKREAIDENHGKNDASKTQKISNLNLGESDGGSLDIKGQRLLRESRSSSENRFIGLNILR